MPEAPLRFRRAGVGDVAAIRDLTRKAYAKWVPVIGREPLPMTADYDHVVRAHVIDLLLRAECPVGLIETVPAVDHLLIENVAVDPDEQGRGLGRRLLAHAEAQAVQAGLPEIRLYTNALFADNLRLYRSLDYLIAREEPFKGGIVVHMVKRIT